jgi:GTP 3',8-cyclase
VTDRCNIRCFYCMPETGVEFRKRSEILISRRSSASRASPWGWASTKLRVTGGEPLVRRDLPVLIRRLAAIPGHPRSGAHHQRRAAAGAGRPLYDAGLRRLNVHLDTLDRARFARSRGATISTRCWPAWRARRLGFAPSS